MPPQSIAAAAVVWCRCCKSDSSDARAYTFLFFMCPVCCTHILWEHRRLWSLHCCHGQHTQFYVSVHACVRAYVCVCDAAQPLLFMVALWPLSLLWSSNLLHLLFPCAVALLLLFSISFDHLNGRAHYFVAEPPSPHHWRSCIVAAMRIAATGAAFGPFVLGLPKTELATMCLQPL